MKVQCTTCHETVKSKEIILEQVPNNIAFGGFMTPQTVLNNKGKACLMKCPMCHEIQFFGFKST